MGFPLSLFCQYVSYTLYLLLINFCSGCRPCRCRGIRQEDKGQSCLMLGIWQLKSTNIYQADFVLFFFIKVCLCFLQKRKYRACINCKCTKYMYTYTVSSKRSLTSDHTAVLSMKQKGNEVFKQLRQFNFTGESFS